MANLLIRDEAAKYLREKHRFKVCGSTLASYAARGTGPAYALAGRTPVYSIAALDAWAASRTSVPERVMAPPDSITLAPPQLAFRADEDVSHAQMLNDAFLSRQLWGWRHKLSPGQVIHVGSKAFRFVGEAMIAGFDDEHEGVAFYWLSLRDLSKEKIRRPEPVDDAVAAE